MAFEPNPAVLPVLKRNLRLNIDNYQVYEQGLGAEEGIRSIVNPAGSENNVGMARLAPSDGHGAIRIGTLDRSVEARNASEVTQNVILIKIDVEGMELSILQGAGRTIEKHRPHIFVEAASFEELRGIREHLELLGYKILSV